MMIKDDPSKFRPAYFVFLASILLVTFLSFWPALKADFLNWDDPTHLLYEPSIRALDGPHLKKMFTQSIHGTYIPLTSLTFAIEYQFFGLDPFYYHLDNVLLHLLVVAGIYFFAFQLRMNHWGAGLTALLFGLHPAHVESVVWVTERKDVLYASFYMAAVLSYTQYLRSDKKYLLVLTTFLGVMSMLAKPMALSLPLILWLLDWYWARKITAKVLLEKVPLLVSILGLAWITYRSFVRIPYQSVLEGLLVWSWTLMFYFAKFCFPVNLLPMYDLPQPVHLAQAPYVLAVIFAILLLCVLIIFRRQRWTLFCLLYFLLSIFFLLRFDYTRDVNIVSDRYLYLPSLGLCLLSAGACSGLLSSKYNKICVLGLLIVFVSFFIKTYRQSQVWNNSASLWYFQLRHTPNNHIALTNIALFLQTKEEYIRAKSVYKKWRFSQESPTEAIPPQAVAKVDALKELFERASQVAPRVPDVHYNLGRFYEDIGENQKAIDSYQKAMAISPHYLDVTQRHHRLLRMESEGISSTLP